MEYGYINYKALSGAERRNSIVPHPAISVFLEDSHTASLRGMSELTLAVL